MWLPGPATRTLEVYRLTGEGWLLAGSHFGDRRARTEPFDAVEIDLALVWSGLGPPKLAEE